MALLSVIRRWALREQLSIRKISRRTGLARNTAKDYPRSGDEQPSYAKRRSSSNLYPFAAKLSTWLAPEASKSRRPQRTLRQLHTSMEKSGQISAESNEGAHGVLLKNEVMNSAANFSAWR